MDTLTPRQRSERMRRVKSRDTKPELELRRLVWALGHRYRKNRPDLIGKPDLTFIGLRRVIFLHGCFWHRHQCASGIRSPKSKKAFWRSKFEQNIERDKRVMSELKASGWGSLVIWECELNDHARVEQKVRKFLDA